MSQLNLVDIPRSGNESIDYILNGRYPVPKEGGSTYTWSFSNTTFIRGENTFEAFTENHAYINMIRDSLDKLSTFANVTFKEVDENSGDIGMIRYWSCDDRSFDYSGIATAFSGYGQDIVLKTYSSNVASHPPYKFSTAAHELGHVMGLEHTQSIINGKWDSDEYKAGITELNTVMTYNSLQSGEKTTLLSADGSSIGEATVKNYGIDDILAYQYIYGANYEYNKGNTTYKYSPNELNYYDTIWDGGGIDTLDFSDFELGSIINLNGGTRSSIYIPVPETNSKNVYDGTHAIGIAYGANIENANGTKGNDVIYGNELNNIINGNAGNDIIYGGAGNDTLNGGDGDDVLYGGDGNDNLNGGNGNDTLYGGNGSDRYFITSTTFRIVEHEGEGSSDEIRVNINGVTNFILPDNVEIFSLYSDFTYNSTLTGNKIDNVLYGNDGNNILIGRKGNDNLVGYLGSDTYIFSRGDGKDTIGEIATNNTPATDTDILVLTDISASQLWFSKKQSMGLTSLNVTILGTTDEITISNWYSYSAKLEQLKTQDGIILSIAQVEALVDIMAQQTMPEGSSSSVIHDYLALTGISDVPNENVIRGNEQDNVINGSSGKDTLYGGAGNDVIDGGDGDDTLYGNEGDDILRGGSGSNILIGGAGIDKFISTGNDTLIGGEGNDRYEIYGTEFRIIEETNQGIDHLYIYINSVTNFVAPENVENISLNTMLMHSSSITGNDLNNVISGNFGDNVLIGGKGDDTLQGYRGSDTYIFNLGDGQDTIWEYSNHDVAVTDKDILLFTDISANQLWFTKDLSLGRESLVVKVLGTSDQILVNEWYSSNCKLEEIKTQDGMTLSINQVESLVDIMANQTMPTASNSSIIDDYMMAQASMMMG
ncbi:hypothetical protein I2492_08190 [Budviciaceae bacterium CWB-B4]|uniref:serralysin n=1 Tax=Limnobaculum xujianqingii TaxID=2738837 RepID=A0A9D7FXG2_9GAMM|nr:calcium-binding protein [Limnobaculum xujianqingii]MBK5072991.1 hypothetical protein [Limnobaculum xujianqingii]MBK5176300.1 hypothetical protein [Limnobaculum xujianqingii]